MRGDVLAGVRFGPAFAAVEDAMVEELLAYRACELRDVDLDAAFDALARNDVASATRTAVGVRMALLDDVQYFESLPDGSAGHRALVAARVLEARRQVECLDEAVACLAEGSRFAAEAHLRRAQTMINSQWWQLQTLRQPLRHGRRKSTL